MKRFKLIYDIDKKNKNGYLKLFEDDFLEFHHNKYKMIVNNKLSALKKEHLIKENNSENLKIILIPFIEYNISLKYMFYDCSLMKFSLIPNNEKKSENKKNNSSKNNNNNDNINKDKTSNKDNANNNVNNKDDINNNDKINNDNTNMYNNYLDNNNLDNNDYERLNNLYPTNLTAENKDNTISLTNNRCFNY